MFALISFNLNNMFIEIEYRVGIFSGLMPSIRAKKGKLAEELYLGILMSGSAWLKAHVMRE